MQVVVEHLGRGGATHVVQGARNNSAAKLIAKHGGRKLVGCGVPTGGAKGGLGKGRISHHDRVLNIK